MLRTFTTSYFVLEAFAYHLVRSLLAYAYASRLKFRVTKVTAKVDRLVNEITAKRKTAYEDFGTNVACLRASVA